MRRCAGLSHSPKSLVVSLRWMPERGTNQMGGPRCSLGNARGRRFGLALAYSRAMYANSATNEPGRGTPLAYSMRLKRSSHHIEQRKSAAGLGMRRIVDNQIEENEECHDGNTGNDPTGQGKGLIILDGPEASRK